MLWHFFVDKADRGIPNGMIGYVLLSQHHKTDFINGNIGPSAFSIGVKVIGGIVTQETESYEDFGITHYQEWLQNLIENIVSDCLMLSNKNIVLL